MVWIHFITRQGTYFPGRTEDFESLYIKSGNLMDSPWLGEFFHL